MLRYDVIVIGSGIIGSTAAICLRRQGFSVLLIDKVCHPRFAIGESTLVPTSMYMTAISEAWGVNEIHDIAVTSRLNTNSMPSSGVKKNFGFLYHKKNVNTPISVRHVAIPGTQEYSNAGESHLFRQDVDSFLAYSAIRSGCEAHFDLKVKDILFDNDGIVLSGDDGQQFGCRYIIDSSGHGSILSGCLGLREKSTRFLTDSRVLFTHMIDVKRYEDLFSSDMFSSAWSEGTLHHFFDGGWGWVIPFNNHQLSRNKLVSVGLCLDRALFPLNESISPVDEFQMILKRFPSIYKQFNGAKAVRPWVRTDRIQYSNKSAMGKNYYVTGHAYGIVDALYSRGMLNSFQNLFEALPIVDSYLRDGRECSEKLGAVNDLMANAFDIQDKLTYGTYASLGHVELHGVWLAIWGIVEKLSVLKILPKLEEYGSSGNISDLFEDETMISWPIGNYPNLEQVLSESVVVMREFSKNKINEDEAIRSIVDTFRGISAELLDISQNMMLSDKNVLSKFGLGHHQLYSF